MEPILQVAAVQLPAEATLQEVAVQVEVTHPAEVTRPAEDIPAVVAAHVQADLPPEGNH